MVQLGHYANHPSKTESSRAADQSEGGKRVGVDPTVITARRSLLGYGNGSGRALTPFSRRAKAFGEDQEERGRRTHGS